MNLRRRFYLGRVAELAVAVCRESFLLVLGRVAGEGGEDEFLEDLQIGLLAGEQRREAIRRGQFLGEDRVGDEEQLLGQRGVHRPLAIARR